MKHDDHFIIVLCLDYKPMLSSQIKRGSYLKECQGFMGVIYLLIWILGNPLSRKKTTSPNIHHPIGNYVRKPRLSQMMLNYL